MKPCKNCPFRPRAPLGMWHPVEYLLVAYLGSVKTYTEPRDIFSTMGCHEFNGITRVGAEASPRCGGWLRAARDSLPLTMQARLGKLTQGELAEMEDGAHVLSPEDMARANGLDVDRLPPLEWAPGDERYPTLDDWSMAVLDLRERLRADPEHARTYVIPGSPLDVGTSDEVIRGCFGEEALQRYKAREGGKNGLEL